MTEPSKRSGGEGGDNGTGVNQGSDGRTGPRGTNGRSQGAGAFSSSSGTIGFMNVTVAQNIALAGEGAGLFNDGSDHVSVNNTLIADNQQEDVVGRFVNSAFNLIGNATRIAGVSNGVNGNQVGGPGAMIAAQLAGLGNNGGPTLTHLLRDGSPAIDAASPTNGPALDQRGRVRPLRSLHDIGAVEAQRSLTMQLPAGGGQYRLVVEGTDLVIRRLTNEVVFRYEAAALQDLTVRGSAATDSLLGDFSSGDILPIGGVRFVAILKPVIHQPPDSKLWAK